MSDKKTVTFVLENGKKSTEEYYDGLQEVVPKTDDYCSQFFLREDFPRNGEVVISPAS